VKSRKRIRQAKEINKEGRQRKNGHYERKARIFFTQTNEIRNVLFG
jgi:hypothetical protein